MSELKRMTRLTWGQAQIEANSLKDDAYPLVKQGLAASEIKRRLSQDAPVVMSDRAFRTFISALKDEWNREIAGPHSIINGVNNCKSGPSNPSRSTPNPRIDPAKVVIDSQKPLRVEKADDAKSDAQAANDKTATSPESDPGGFLFNPNPDPKKIFGDDK